MAITTTNLVSYWNFDESSGNLIDQHGSYDGTLVNAPTQGDTGIINDAYDFDGTNQYVECGDISELSGASKMSFSCWFAPDGTVNDTIAAQWDYQTQGCFSIQSDTGSKLVVFIANALNDNGGNQMKTDAAAFSGTGWHHLLVVYDGTQGTSANRVKIYVNGSIVASTEAGTLPATLQNSSAQFRFGVFTGLGRYWDGGLDECGLWVGEAMTETQAGELYNSGAGLAYPFTTGTNFQINIGNAWKEIPTMKINIGDAWKAIASAKINIGDAWKAIF